MKGNLDSYIAIFTAIGTLAGIIITAYKVMHTNLTSSKSQKRSKYIKIIEESKRLEIDKELTDHFIERYQQQSIYELTGLNMKPEHFKMVIRNEVLASYSDKSIRRIVRYLSFQGDNLSIEITRKEKIKFILFCVLAAALFLAWFYTYTMAFFSSSGFWLFMVTCIIAYFSSVLVIWVKIKPYRLAKRIEKEFEDRLNNAFSSQITNVIVTNN